MQKLGWSLIGLLGLDIVLVTIQLVWAVTAGINVPVSDFAPLLIAAGVLGALVSLTFTARRNSSEDFLESAKELLERCYTTLAQQVDGQGRPRNNRIMWLAAARFLRAAENTAKHITEPSHKAIFIEQREYWRARLYDLIFPTYECFPSSYYAEKPEHMALAYGDKDHPPLSEKSLAVLYRFVRWPQGFSDPIKDEPIFSEEEIEKMQAFGPRGLGDLMARVRALKK